MSIKVSDSAELHDEGFDGTTVYAEYDVLKVWRVRVEGQVELPPSGGVKLQVEPIDYNGLVREDSLTTEVLRAVPMLDARHRLERLKLEAMVSEGHAHPMPERFKSDRDYAVLASLYVQASREAGNGITKLAKLHGISRNTVAARLRTARQRGFLDRDRDGSERLTESAHALVEEH